jgi:UDP-glucose 4-epimerase
MLKNNIQNIVFSSSAAIYGNPLNDFINEDHSKKPINPYGKSKLMVENILKDACKAHNINATSLRYFNAAGAHKSGEIGESHEPETHLIPRIIKSVLSKKNDFVIYGNDYPTKDGTCIRDYVHVDDLINAHMQSLDFMKKNKGFSAFNLGNGKGFSILEVIDSCERVTNTKIPYRFEDRRKGDPSILVADCTKAKESLKWEPKLNDIDSIVKSAYLWHRKSQELN